MPANQPGDLRIMTGRGAWLREAATALVLTLIALALGWWVTGGRAWALPFAPGAAYSDAVTAHYSAAQHLADIVEETGEFPVWWNTTFGGTPFAANPLNKTAYPLQWIVAFVTPRLFLLGMIALHGLIGGLGMWAWLRSLHISRWGAAIGTLGYVLSPRWIAQLGLGHLDLWYALAWLPLLLLTLQCLLTADRVTANRLILPGLIGALLGLADVRAALYGLVLAAGYALVLLMRERDWRCGLRLLPPLTISLLLTAALTLPLIGWLPYLTRSGLTQAEAGLDAIPLAAGSIGLILPAHLGGAETFTYLGLSIALLAIVGTIRQHRARGWAIAAALAAWWALGAAGGLWTIVTGLIPVLTSFRVPGRAWLLVALIAPLLAAYGVDTLRAALSRRAAFRWAAGLLIIGVTCVALGGVALLTPTLPPTMGVSALLFGTGAALLIAVRLSGRLPFHAAALALLLLTGADLLLTARARLEWRSSTSWVDPHLPLARALTDLQPDRIYSPTYSVPQPIAAYEYLHLFGGIDPFQIAVVSAAIQRGAGTPSGFTGYSIAQPPLLGMIGEDVRTANREQMPDPVVLAAWGVSHVVSAYPLTVPGLSPLRVIDDQHIYANDRYDPGWLRDPVTGWPTNWPDLPDPAVVRELNTLTVTAAGVSAIGFVLCGVILLLSSLLRLRYGS